MRYIVTGPVNGGYQWWDVRDSLDLKMPNRTLASFSTDLGELAWDEANRLCQILNEQNATRSTVS